jgi:hypothetical protein
MEPSSFQIESSLSPEEVRAALSKRCREWRWPPSMTSRAVYIGQPRIAGGPERFRMWLWPAGRATTPVLDCRTVAKPGGGCTVRVRMRRSRANQLSGIAGAAWLGGVPLAAGWEDPEFMIALGLVVGAALSLFEVYGTFRKETGQRMRSLVEILHDAANPEATSAARRAS